MERQIFYREWEAYENGFGDLDAEFWLGDSLSYHNGQAFTTKNRDNDPWASGSYQNNCGIYSQGTWWYVRCAHSNLNGLYMEGGQIRHQGVFWNNWKNTHYSMKSSSMMIRRL